MTEKLRITLGVVLLFVSGAFAVDGILGGQIIGRVINKPPGSYVTLFSGGLLFFIFLLVGLITIIWPQIVKNFKEDTA